MKRHLLSSLIAATLACGPAWAGTPSPNPAPSPNPKPSPEAIAKSEAARAEIDRLVQRIQELSHELVNTDVQVKVIRMDRDGEHGDSHRRREIRTEHVLAGPKIGIGIVMSPHEGKGVRIAAVTPEGPAAKAGVKVGDVLVSVDGKAISGSQQEAIEQARTLLSNLEQNQKVKLGYLREGKSGNLTVSADTIRRAMLVSSGTPMWSPGFDIDKDVRVVIDPNIRIEIDRAREGLTHAAAGVALAPCADGDRDCHFPALAQALRWNGLNLASVDAKLGRYFGTASGVLVLSGGGDLPGLEAGDVIQRIDGEAVSSPREAMRLLREHESGSQVQIDVLRERKPLKIDVTVPAAPAMRWFAPPAQPTPPAAPPPPKPGVAPPTPPAAPAQPAPPAPPNGLAATNATAIDTVGVAL